MIEKVKNFLSGCFCIKLTPDDIPWLSDLQDVLSVRWASGDRIDSHFTLSILDGSDVYIYGKIDHILFSSAPRQSNVVTLAEFLEVEDFDTGIEEAELMSLLGE